MKQFLESEAFVLSFTLIIYFLAQQLQDKYRLILLNPILVSSAIIILFLTVFNINYASYHQGVRLIEFFLKPDVVAMGVPYICKLKG